MVMRMPPHTEATIEVAGISSMVVHLLNNAFGESYITSEMGDHITLTMLRHEISVRCMWSDVTGRMGVDDLEAMVIPLFISPHLKQHIIFNCNLIIDDIEVLISEYLNNILPLHTWDIILLIDTDGNANSVRLVNEGDYRIKDWIETQIQHRTRYSRTYSPIDLGLTNEIHFFH